MSATASPSSRLAPATPAVAGVRSASSIGVSRYCDRLANALAELGVDYALEERPVRGRSAHFHVANSSRHAILHARRASRYLVTLHDVLPRTRLLEPAQRALVYPVVSRARATIVHSRFAADLLRSLGVRTERLEVIPHPASVHGFRDAQAARAELGLDDGRLVALLPGVLKRAKLVEPAVRAYPAVREDWQLVLAGRVHDHVAADEARRVGAVVLESPDDARYEQAMVAADVVLCLRERSVGESNGPLLDAIGAGRPVLANCSGSIPEIAGDAALYVGPTAAEIAEGLRALADTTERVQHARAAEARAAELTWAASARAHRDVFAEVLGG
jgi:glycosyltransferase involved in cell wall biosynthesis